MKYIKWAVGVGLICAGVIGVGSVLYGNPLPYPVAILCGWVFFGVFVAALGIVAGILLEGKK
jgi:hypothetical protein